MITLWRHVTLTFDLES